ncbi:unnamed protein product [Zymoseptoria tritici ST99CH_1A5]|uniref:Enoyl reductase (ER) domain-containing protein n=3 Tax=Zymoseptoria tritici TaxID=1047171 RepID=A0A1X7RMI9_ZYMT9|nr:unnamed protein product [Zymoseptoria tritici ST99CH_3D7]SMR48407.1 unnamed protein product [Zymoseptoria tritici ST99CH_1E4]SMY22316.1 unnamed protein product [Zymoseptoria tritici ST99CH_1A5]
MAPGTMKAARYYGKEDIQIKDDIPIPECGDDQVLIQPAFVGVCGTDLHEYMGGPNFSPTSAHPVTKEKIPITIGHEFSGTIKSFGKNVTGLTVGQQVAIQPTIFCGQCGACGVNAENACPSGGFIGLSGGGGGMSEFVTVPHRAVFPLPASVPLDIGALVEPLAVAWHAVDASPIAEYPTGAEPKCMVLGGGPIGLAVVQVLLARGCSTVICVEVAKKRQQFAKDFGASHVLDPTKEDIATKALEICGGKNGPDIIFDCAGVPQSLETACKSVRSRGTVVNVAIWEKEVPFNPNWLVFREASYKAVLGYQAKDFQGVVDALGEGRLKPQGMITSKVKMGELVEKAYLPLIHEKDEHVKILVDMQGSL